MEINTPRRVPGEKSEFSHFHFRPAWLCWSSARSLGLNFLCCGRDTTRTFIVHDELPSSEEQQLFWAHETRGSVPRPHSQVMTFKWGSSALWPSLISCCHRKWIVFLSRIAATVQCRVPLSSDVIGGWRRRTIALICASCAHICQTESLCRCRWVGDQQHHRIFEIITNKDFEGEKNRRQKVVFSSWLVSLMTKNLYKLKSLKKISIFV